MSPLPPLNGQDSAALWERYRQLLWHDPDLCLWLDVSRMALEERDLKAFEVPFARAFAAMQALEAGAIANADEGRQVGHYWLRAPELAPDPAVAAAISAEVDRLESFGREVLEGTVVAPGGDRKSVV